MYDSVHPLEHSIDIDEDWADSERPQSYSRYDSQCNEVPREIK
jgi:hypothetical protein